MYAAMNKKSGRLDVVSAGNLAAVRVYDDEIARRELRPMHALRVDEEASRHARYFQAEVIAHAFAKSKP
jgi:hypothetical protein